MKSEQGMRVTKRMWKDGQKEKETECQHFLLKAAKFKMKSLTLQFKSLK